MRLKYSHRYRVFEVDGLVGVKHRQARAFARGVLGIIEGDQSLIGSGDGGEPPRHVVTVAAPDPRTSTAVSKIRFNSRFNRVSAACWESSRIAPRESVPKGGEARHDRHTQTGNNDCASQKLPHTSTPAATVPVSGVGCLRARGCG